METSQSWIANIAILNKLLAKETWYNTFWAKFSGQVDISKDDNGNKVYQPSGNTIEILNDFVSQGRDNMLLPFLKELSGEPVFGDTVLKGTGEDQTMQWLRTYVNQYRKAVMKRSGQMSEQRQKLYKLYDAARPQLSRWFSKFENQSIFATFYEGVSPNLSKGTNSDGLGVYKRYNPNWYVNDGGVVTAVGTAGTTKTAAELDTAVGNADSKMDAEVLRKLRTTCMNLRIPTMSTVGGNPFWCIVMHPAQIESLWSDSDFRTAQREAFSTKMVQSPELTGIVGYYAGFAIYEDIIGVRGWDTTNDDMGFGTVSEMFSPTDVTDNYNALVFGKSAVGRAVAKDLHFTQEVDDHENTIEIGGAMINGYSRNDYFTESTSGDSSGGGATNAFSKGNATASVANAIAATNQSSLVLMTDETGS